jgi:hypothetical protein
MQRLKISLVHGGILSQKCSVVFMKHIEAMLSRPEKAIDEKMKGRLSSLYEKREMENDIKIETTNEFPFPYLYIINFHHNDLPFSYSSVDAYARRIVGFAVEDESITKAATTIHGPGAGLDASEALETMLVALADELHFRGHLGNLEQVLFIEREREIFDRVQERIKYLDSDKGIISIEGNNIFLQPVASARTPVAREKRVEQLSLNSLFIAMPFKAEFDNIYYYGIKKPIEDLGRKCERLDQEQFVGDIIERLKQRISAAELVIADITGNNPNVFYEIGYAEGIKKRVVLISQEKELPFDLRTQRQISYAPEKLRSLETQLKDLLSELLKNSQDTTQAH